MNEPVELSFLQILSCLSLIERYVPKINNFSLYSPSPTFNANDIISIQNEAKRMMEFIGMKGYTTVVTFCTTDDNTAGNINLNKSNEVFIQISNKLKKERRRYNDAVLSVLAHEIGHKYLYVNGLYLNDNLENEYCTDVATFFVGFGTLTINGCFEEYTSEDRHADGGVTIVKQILRSGYLTLRSYFTVHQIVCKIHNIDFLEGINEYMRFYISPYKNDSIRSTLISREALIKKFKLQSESLANTMREICMMKEYLRIKEKQILSLYEKNDKRFNHLLLNKEAVKEKPYAAMHMLHLSDPEGAEENKLSRFLEFVEPENYELIDNILVNIQCPFCGKISNNKLSERGLKIVKCQCGKIFYWDSRPITISRDVNNKTDESVNTEESAKGSKTHRFHNLFRKILKL